MAKKKRVRGFFKRVFNVKAWIGYNHIKSGAGFISTAINNLVDSIPSEQAKHESFEQAVTEQGLSEKDIELAQHNYHRNALIFFLVGMLCVLNTLHLIYTHKMLAALVSFAVTIMIFIFSLRAHFWFFQIKNRKLGCSLTEWYHNKVK